MVRWENTTWRFQLAAAEFQSPPQKNKNECLLSPSKINGGPLRARISFQKAYVHSDACAFDFLFGSYRCHFGWLMVHPGASLLIWNNKYALCKPIAMLPPVYSVLPNKMPTVNMHHLWPFEHRGQWSFGLRLYGFPCLKEEKRKRKICLVLCWNWLHLTYNAQTSKARIKYGMEIWLDC